MSHNLQEAGQASNQATDVGQANAGRSTQRGQVGGNAPTKRANCFSSHAPSRTTGTYTASWSQTNHVKTHSLFLGDEVQVDAARPVEELLHGERGYGAALEARGHPASLPPFLSGVTQLRDFRAFADWQPPWFGGQGRGDG